MLRASASGPQRSCASSPSLARTPDERGVTRSELTPRACSSNALPYIGGKVAVTFFDWSIVTVQVVPVVPLHAPSQLALPPVVDDEIAVRMTTVPGEKVALHALPGHWMPVGELDTKPMPVTWTDKV